MATLVAAQAQPEHVIHVWVDPHYGCDEPFGSSTLGAASLNPNILCNTPCNTVAPSCITPAPPCNGEDPVNCTADVFRPNDVVDSSGAVLLHAPYPFRTVTAALKYIPPLPYHGSAHQPNKQTWKYAIIHCLPGVYARANGRPSFGNRHPDNGLKINGETFPIRLPPGVSIQGTSALNTIFYLADEIASSGSPGQGPAFAFADQPGSPAIDRSTFIDSISIQGAAPQSVPQGKPETMAAIYVGPYATATPTISNCFVFMNRIGVLVASNYDNKSIAHHGLALINNTFAFNQMGLWNGELPLQPATTVVSGLSKLILVNNIFDSGLMDNGAGYPSCPYARSWEAPWGSNAGWNFDGVDEADMKIQSPGPAKNFNAFEYAARAPGSSKPAWRYNPSDQPPVGPAFPLSILNQTSNRSAPGVNPPFVPDASRNIAAITGWAIDHDTTFRGVLYVRDLFCRLKQALPTQIPSSQFDLSAMDFRLAPAAALAAQGPSPQAPSLLNPLVDNGWGSAAAGAFPLTMANGQTLPAPPGTLTVSNPNGGWAFHSWDHDAEGFGNARLHNHPEYLTQITQPPSQYEGVVDVGADEVGETILGGYVYGTTGFWSFQNNNPASKWPLSQLPPDNRYVWSFGPPSSLVVDSHDPDLPYFREVLGQGPGPSTYPHLPWFAPHVPPAAPRPAWKFDLATCTCPPCWSYSEATLVDITPYLRPDLHPWWGAPTPGPTWPIWQWCNGMPNYNWVLYIPPTVGIINPPGTYLGGIYQPPSGPALEFDWLDLSFPTSGLGDPVQFGPFVGSAPSQITSFDTWCRSQETGKDLRYDVLPDTFPVGAGSTLTAVRFSVETADHGTWGGPANPQSFLVIVEGPQ